MNILMISTDRALLGERIGTGDAVARHRRYARYSDKLDIIVFSRSNSGPKTDNSAGSAQFGYQPKQLADNLFCYPTNSASPLFYFKDAKKIAKEILSAGPYDLVVCQDPFLTGLVGRFIKYKFKMKLLIHFHGDFWQNKYWLKENILNYLFLLISHFTVKAADAIRVVSPRIKKKLVKAGVSTYKIKVINTPVDLDKFKISNNQAVNSIKKEFGNSKIIFWVGRMSREKNLSWLLKSFKKIIAEYPYAVLFLAGYGREFDKINKLSAALGLNKNIKLIGTVDYEDLINYYYASDIVVLPSLHESFGKVFLEAAACAKPVVASRTTGASAIVKHKKTGFLVPINNQKQFTDRVVKLLKDEDLAHSMGTAAYNYIHQEFNYGKNVKNVVDYWQEIIMGLKLAKAKIK